MKLGEALNRREVAAHIFELCREAHAFRGRSPADGGGRRITNSLGYALLVTKRAHDTSYSGKARASRLLAEELLPVRFVRVAQGCRARAPRARVRGFMPPYSMHVPD